MWWTARSVRCQWPLSMSCSISGAARTRSQMPIHIMWTVRRLISSSRIRYLTVARWLWPHLSVILTSSLLFPTLNRPVICGATTTSQMPIHSSGRIILVMPRLNRPAAGRTRRQSTIRAPWGIAFRPSLHGPDSWTTRWLQMQAYHQIIALIMWTMWNMIKAIISRETLQIRREFISRSQAAEVLLPELYG